MASETECCLHGFQDVRTTRPGLPRVRRAGEEQTVANHETEHRGGAADPMVKLYQQQPV